MAKKVFFVIAVVLLAVLTVVPALAGVAAVVMSNLGYSVTTDIAYQKSIVFIGDSIAEALIGPSPLGERDNYGYYAVLGKVNEFQYYNHAVSGHKTSGGMVDAEGEGLLQVLQREDENATLMKTHLANADIIDISVLGNNILQYNLGLLLLEVADPEFETKYAAGTTLINALEEGRTETRPSIEDPGEVVTFNFPNTRKDLEDIIARLKELNPDALIIFQTVYNPFYENSTHMHEEVKQALAKIVDTKGEFGPQGAALTTVAQYRAVAGKLLNLLNSNLQNYLDTHNGDEFIILDINKKFNEITNLDVDENNVVNLSENCLGRYLIYEDWTHPSNFGHAVIADATQELLVSLELVDEQKAISNYKALRLEQLGRMYFGVEGFDYGAAYNAVNAAETFEDVTLAYFLAIRGYTPIY